MTDRETSIRCTNSHRHIFWKVYQSTNSASNSSSTTNAFNFYSIIMITTSSFPRSFCSRAKFNFQIFFLCILIELLLVFHLGHFNFFFFFKPLMCSLVPVLFTFISLIIFILFSVPFIIIFFVFLLLLFSLLFVFYSKEFSFNFLLRSWWTRKYKNMNFSPTKKLVTKK